MTTASTESGKSYSGSKNGLREKTLLKVTPRTTVYNMVLHCPTWIDFFSPTWKVGALEGVEKAIKNMDEMTHQGIQQHPGEYCQERKSTPSKQR